MNEEELKQYVHSYTQPSMVDVEMAKRLILEELSPPILSDRGVITLEAPFSRVSGNLSREKGPTPEGYIA